MIRKYLFERWWIPTLSCIGAMLLPLLIEWKNESDWFYYIWMSLVVSTTLLMLVSAIWQLIKGKWYWGLLQIAILWFAVSYVYFALVITLMFGPSGDTFAAQLSLPDNVPLEHPIDLSFDLEHTSVRPDSLSMGEATHLSFQLYNSFQPGLYEYDCWMHYDGKGHLYLRAFEITGEVELSAERLTTRSRIPLHETNGAIVRFGTTDHFTIYEGDWGQPYAARFEVWLEPAGGGPHRKLLEKNYIIEGWMR